MMVRRLATILALTALATSAAADTGRAVAHPGSGFGTFAAPGQAVPGPRVEPAGAAAQVTTVVDPTNKLDALEYSKFLEGFRALRSGKAWVALDADTRAVLVKLAVTEASWRYVQAAMYRDDPVYVVDEDRPMGPVRRTAEGGRVRDVPVLEVVPMKLPKKGGLQRVLVKPRPFIIDEPDTSAVVFRVLLPMYGRQADGTFRREPLRYLRLPKLPEPGARSVAAPVDESGAPLVVPLGQAGGAVAGADLLRKGYGPGDELLAYDNRTAPRLSPEELHVYLIVVDLTAVPR